MDGSNAPNEVPRAAPHGARRDASQPARSGRRGGIAAVLGFAAWIAAGLLPTSPVHAGTDVDPLALVVQANRSLVAVSWIDPRRPQSGYVRVGAVVRKDGLVLVAGPTGGAGGRYIVRLPNGATALAEFIAADQETALTLLRVAGKTLVPLTGLTPAPVAAPRRSTPALGATVYLVSTDNVLARGALRATGRYDRVRSARRVVLRTTGLLEAALSSLTRDRGAPWFATDGSLVGLHYGRIIGTDPTLAARAAAAQVRLRREVVGSYAVPAAVVRTVWPLLAAHRRVPRGALRIRTQTLDDAMRAQVCPGCGGHVVLLVEPDGPGAKAGLQPHDLILSVAGTPVPVGGSLQDALLPHRPGAVVALGILRAGVRSSVSATLADRSR